MLNESAVLEAPAEISPEPKRAKPTKKPQLSKDAIDSIRVAFGRVKFAGRMALAITRMEGEQEGGTTPQGICAWEGFNATLDALEILAVLAEFADPQAEMDME